MHNHQRFWHIPSPSAWSENGRNFHLKVTNIVAQRGSVWTVGERLVGRYATAFRKCHGVTRLGMRHQYLLDRLANREPYPGACCRSYAGTLVPDIIRGICSSHACIRLHKDLREHGQEGLSLVYEQDPRTSGCTRHCMCQHTCKPIHSLGKLAQSGQLCA